MGIRKSRRKWLMALLAAASVSMLTFMPTYAAKNNNITSVKPNKVMKFQLDGQGEKEKVKLSTQNSTIEPYEVDGKSYNHSLSVTLEINGKSIYNNSFDYYVYDESYNDRYAWNADLVVADVNKKDKIMDLFLGVNSGLYSGTYKDLLHITYKNGKATIDRMDQTLSAIKTPSYEKYNTVFANMLNPLESYKGLANGDIVVPGGWNGEMDHLLVYRNAGRGLCS